jgi:hypothetical protein
MKAYPDEGKPMTDETPQDAQIAMEFKNRAHEAATIASNHEEQARQWRAVERACIAGLDTLEQLPPEARRSVA